jgi:hypothetical protein
MKLEIVTSNDAVNTDPVIVANSVEPIGNCI